MRSVSHSALNSTRSLGQETELSHRLGEAGNDALANLGQRSILGAQVGNLKGDTTGGTCRAYPSIAVFKCRAVVWGNADGGGGLEVRSGIGFVGAHLIAGEDRIEVAGNAGLGQVVPGHLATR